MGSRPDASNLCVTWQEPGANAFRADSGDLTSLPRQSLRVLSRFLLRQKSDRKAAGKDFHRQAKHVCASERFPAAS